MSDHVFTRPYAGEEDRRSGSDRRHHTLQTLWHALHGRRRLGRRQKDQINSLVDRYEPHHLFVFLGIVGLCCLDAFFTLSLIESGKAYEANPLMHRAMAEGDQFFFVIKLVSTGVALFILLALKNFYFLRCIKVSYLLYGTFIMYAVLIKYELWLFHL